ncbi:peptidase S28 [Microdochium trichocladiopsis]|uniref:Peptidase S28 n=1 Tax=Microdochium trichocladiopsis TaxID=1682393 RepID=A0A9P9BP39_9PEZI|nr:peptidase S28 [Microdochium trichocladiopsis]KAH7032739.1 peptidase S28 [Microdochium trichocladiopsis]
MVRLGALAGVLALAASAQAFQPPLHIQRLLQQAKTHGNARVEDVAAAAPDYKEYFLQTPVDHFHNESKYEPHSNETFGLRYWFDAQYYKPGGPVIVLAGGETSGAGRLPFLEKGIVYELTKATGGLGVILEHRYYGTSYPTEDFSTENLRFLTTEQSLADTAFFAKNVKFEGLEDVDLNPKTTPWIAYGGSYAGSYVAFLRMVYPDVYYGAISSSGVPEAIWDYWQYFEAARIYAPGECSITTQKLQNAVDNILIKQKGTKYPAQLKQAFGYSGTANDLNFAGVLSTGIYGLQSYNWDPEESDNSFFDYCETISSDEVIFNNTEAKRDVVKELLTVGGYGEEVGVLTNRTLNWIGWLYRTVGFACEGDDESCFGVASASTLAAVDHSQTWRLWQYQVCTEWGYLQTGSGTPEDQLSMISRLIDLESQAVICQTAFNITEPADLEIVNKFGGFAASYPRVAWLDGEWDPWRAAGVHAIGLPPRESTVSEPYILIDKAVHHWDENGVFESEQTPDFPPKPVAEAKTQIREFVKAWLAEWGTGY